MSGVFELLGATGLLRLPIQAALLALIVWCTLPGKGVSRRGAG